MGDRVTLPAVPIPGRDLVPDGWWKTEVMPWADAQAEQAVIQEAAAQLDALVAAYKTLGLDTVELLKARRYLEIRWGELLGEAKVGTNQYSEGLLASNPSPEKQDRHRFRKLAGRKDKILHRLETADTEEAVTRAALLRAANGQAMVSSDETEWHTPAVYVDAAREALGGIDLDPASSTEANATIRARRFHSVADDGLSHRWQGRVWLNPPYGRQGPRFIERLLADFEVGDVTAAVCLVNSHSTDAAWFQPLWDHTLCFTNHRINFWNGAGGNASGSTHGSVFVYFGSSPQRFVDRFQQFGAVVEKRP